MIEKIILILLGIFIIWGVITVIRKFLLGKIKDTDNRYHANKFISFFGFFLTVLLIGFVYSNKLGKVSVAFGIAGAGVAFALQEVIASVAGWFAIIFGNLFRTGDRIQLGGIKGDVIDIGVLRTTLMEIGQWIDADLYNGRIVLISNNSVFKDPVFNYTADFPFLWDEIKIPIQYGSDYKLAEEIFKEAIKQIEKSYSEDAHNALMKMVNKYMIEDVSTEPAITLIANENWVEFTIRYAVEIKKRRSTKNLLHRYILSGIESSKGLVKYASSTYHLIETPVPFSKMNKE